MGLFVVEVLYREVATYAYFQQYYALKDAKAERNKFFTDSYLYRLAEIL